MLRNEPLLGALRSFVTAMSTDYDLASTSLELIESSAAALSAAGAGVSVADLAGNLRLVAATDHRVIEIEQAQEEAQQGPCVNAFQSQKVVTASGHDALGEWPAVAAAAQRLGFSSAMGVPLSSGDTRVGALSWASGWRRRSSSCDDTPDRTVSNFQNSRMPSSTWACDSRASMIEKNQTYEGLGSPFSNPGVCGKNSTHTVLPVSVSSTPQPSEAASMSRSPR